jgi:hypothetical protein
MQKNANLESSASLAQKALGALTVGQIEDLLAHAKGDLGGLYWRDLGDRPNNAGTVQISSSAAAALIERVTNAIDGVLELKTLEHTGTVPASPRIAAQERFGIPRAGLSAMSEAERRKLAERIAVVLGESGERERPTVVVSDHGVGQHPLDAPSTLLSLNEKNKLGKPYLQGAYGQGASATYRFSRYTVVVMRRKPSLNGGRDDVAGWSVVWEDPGDVNVDKLPIYRYLVDEHGEIPTFEPSALEDDSWHGVRVAHICYDLRGYTAAYTQPKNGAWALLHSSVFDPVLPFLVEGRRAIDAKAAGGSSSRVVIGNAARLDNPSGPRGDLSVTYKNALDFDLGKATGRGLGRLGIRYWVLQRPPGSTSTSDPTASYVGVDAAVTMTLSGQRQDAESRTWLKNRTELPFLARNLIVQVDVDDLSPLAKRELFSSTRERAVDGDLRDLIYDELVGALKEDAELRRLEREEREKVLAQSTEQVDEKVRERLRKHIQSRLPNKKRKVKKNKLVAEPPPSSGSGGPGNRDRNDSHLPAEPTTMRFERDPIALRQGGRTTVWVEINAKNDYLPNHDDQLQVRFDSRIAGEVVIVSKSRLAGGRSMWRLQADADAPEGSFEIEAVLMTSAGVINAKSTVEIVPAKKRRKRQMVEEQDTGPEITWIRSGQWPALGWEEQTVGEVRVDAEKTVIMVNRDQRLLRRALDDNKKLASTVIEQRASRYLFPVACGLFEQHRATKERKNTPDAEYVAGELERMAESVLLVIDQDALADG